MRLEALVFVVLVVACGGEPEPVPLLEPTPTPRTNTPPSFPDGATVRLVATGEVVHGQPYVAEWTLMWPAATDAEGLAAYAIMLNGEEVARIEADREGYDLGEVPEENRAYTIVAVDEGGLEASLDFVLPATFDARMQLANRPLWEQVGSLREAGPGTDPRSPMTVSGRSAERPRARVEIGRPTEVVGGAEFETSIVTRTMRRRVGAIRRCYEIALRAEPTLAGTITIRFSVEARGIVGAASIVDNGTGSDEVGQCLLNTVRRLRFGPPPSSEMTYQYPLVFTSQ